MLNGTDIPAHNNCQERPDRLSAPIKTNDYIERAIGLGHEQGEKHKQLANAGIALFLFGNEVNN